MATFDEYLTTLTQDHILPKVVDNVLNSNVAAVRWLSNARRWAGEQLKIPFKNSKNTSSGTFGIGDTFTTTKVNTRKMLAFDPKFYYANVSLFGPEVDVNAISETQVISLVKTEMESVQQDAMDEVGGLLYGVQSGDDFQGIGSIVDDGTNQPNYGGQTRSTVTNLNSDVNTVSGALTVALMSSAHSASKRGSRKPTLALTSEAIWDDYEALIQPQIAANYSIMGSHKVTKNGTAMPGQPLGPGQAGFDALLFRGMPLVADEKHPEGELEMINEDYIDWYGIRSQWAKPISLSSTTMDSVYDGDVPSRHHGFHWTGFKEPVNQYARSGQILLMGNLISGGPRNHSKLESLT